MTREIPLTRNQVAIVDDEDYDWLSQWKWTFTQKSARYTGYAYRHVYKSGGGVSKIFLHRLILDAPPGVGVDHINGNGLDNQRSNLRLATHQQNMRNRRSQDGGTSIYKGVRQQKCEQWQASLHVDGTYRAIGVFNSEIEAAKAYDAAAVYHYGEFARTNFDPPAPPEIDPLRQARGKRGAASAYRGVFFQLDIQQWVAKIGHKSVQHYLGRFESEIEATRAYDRAAIELHGERAKLNFPAEHLNSNQHQEVA